MIMKQLNTSDVLKHLYKSPFHAIMLNDNGGYCININNFKRKFGEFSSGVIKDLMIKNYIFLYEMNFSASGETKKNWYFK